MSKKQRGKITDITIRLRRVDGRRPTEADARAALWAAHKIAQRGGDVSRELREWRIDGIDWHNIYATGKEKTYQYRATDIDTAIAAMGGILEDIGMKGIRIAFPDRTGER